MSARVKHRSSKRTRKRKPNTIGLLKAILDSNLTPHLKATCSAYVLFGDGFGGRIYPSVDHVAWQVGKKERALRADVKALIEMKVFLPDEPERVVRRKSGTVVTNRFGGQHHTSHFRFDVAALPSRPPWVPKSKRNKRGSGLPPSVAEKAAVQGKGRRQSNVREGGSRAPANAAVERTERRQPTAADREVDREVDREADRGARSRCSRAAPRGSSRAHSTAFQNDVADVPLSLHQEFVRKLSAAAKITTAEADTMLRRGYADAVAQHPRGTLVGDNFTFWRRWFDQQQVGSVRPRMAHAGVSGESAEEFMERIGYCFHIPRCCDSAICRAKRAAEKGTTARTKTSGE